MGFQDNDFCQKLMKVLTFDKESITPDPDLIHALLRMSCSSNIHVSHVNPYKHTVFSETFVPKGGHSDPPC